MAEIRQHYAPEPNALGAKGTRCFECGETFWQWEGQYKDSCPQCSADRHAASVRSMRNKEGYMYERWVRNRYLSALAEMERLGLTPET